MENKILKSLFLFKNKQGGESLLSFLLVHSIQKVKCILKAIPLKFCNHVSKSYIFNCQGFSSRLLPQDEQKRCFRSYGRRQMKKLLCSSQCLLLQAKCPPRHSSFIPILSSLESGIQTHRSFTWKTFFFFCNWNILQHSGLYPAWLYHGLDFLWQCILESCAA